MKQIVCKQLLSEEQIKSYAGRFLDKSLIKYHISEDTKCVTEDGKTIAIFKKNAVPEEILDKVRPSFRKSIAVSNNRGLAGGRIDEKFKVGDKAPDGRIIGKIQGTRFWKRLKNGQLSKTTYAMPVESSVIGYNDRYTRAPYCRQTAFTSRNWLQYQNCLQYIKYVDNFFKDYMPERYKKQKMMVENTAQDFVIRNTAFSTITVNKNFRTAGHYDAGDLKEGFGNLGVISLGNYDGGVTIIPKYGVGLDLKNGDLALFDVHELHGNTEIIKKSWYERISIVCYYRENMIYCGDTEYELNRAKTGTRKKFLPQEEIKAKKIRERVLNGL